MRPKLLLIIFHLLPHSAHCVYIPICPCCFWSWIQSLLPIAIVLNKVFLATLNNCQNDFSSTVLKNTCLYLSPWGSLHVSIRTRGGLSLEALHCWKKRTHSSIMTTLVLIECSLLPGLTLSTLQGLTPCPVFLPRLLVVSACNLYMNSISSFGFSLDSDTQGINHNFSPALSAKWISILSVRSQYLDFFSLKWVKFVFGPFSHNSRFLSPTLNVILPRISSLQDLINVKLWLICFISAFM